jgi:integrase
MASIQPRSGKFRVSVCKDRVRETATFETRKEAVGWGKRREVEIPNELRRARSGATLAQVIERFIAEEVPERGDDRREINALKRLARTLPCAGKRIAKIDADDLQEWVRWRKSGGVKGSTVNRELNLLSAVFETARKSWKLIAHNPLRDVERPENPPPRVRRISHDEEKRVLDALDHNPAAPRSPRQLLAVAFLLALETGMRQGEILGLRWEHVYLEARYVHLPKTKNGDARDVPLSRCAVELIRALPATGPRCIMLSSSQADHLWRDNCIKAAGLVDLHFHDSRHEACTRLARKLPIADLARMLGWRDINSLRVYYNPTASEIALRLD